MVITRQSQRTEQKHKVELGTTIHSGEFSLLQKHADCELPAIIYGDKKKTKYIQQVAHGNHAHIKLF